MFFEPIEGKRHVVFTDQRTAVDWAHQIRNLIDVEHPRAERITMVMDNLNTQTGTLYIRRSLLRKREEFWINWKSTVRPSMVVG